MFCRRLRQCLAIWTATRCSLHYGAVTSRRRHRLTSTGIAGGQEHIARLAPARVTLAGTVASAHGTVNVTRCKAHIAGVTANHYAANSRVRTHNAPTDAGCKADGCGSKRSACGKILKSLNFRRAPIWLSR